MQFDEWKICSGQAYWISTLGMYYIVQCSPSNNAHYFTRTYDHIREVAFGEKEKWLHLQ